MSVVFRVEHPAFGRTSPYDDGDLAELLALCSDSPDDARPAPSRDPAIASHWRCLAAAERRSMRFGFASIEAYRRWFNTRAARAWLAERGYVLAEFVVPASDVVQDKRQLVFRAAAARHLGDHDCRTQPTSEQPPHPRGAIQGAAR